MSLVVTAVNDGVTADITEAVKTMYDCIAGSMDWGSGFLTAEDAEQIMFVAHTCGFVTIEEAAQQLRAYQRYVT